MNSNIPSSSNARLIDVIITPFDPAIITEVDALSLADLYSIFSRQDLSPAVLTAALRRVCIEEQHMISLITDESSGNSAPAPMNSTPERAPDACYRNLDFDTLSDISNTAIRDGLLFNDVSANALSVHAVIAMLDGIYVGHCYRWTYFDEYSSVTNVVGLRSSILQSCDAYYEIVDILIDYLLHDLETVYLRVIQPAKALNPNLYRRGLSLYKNVRIYTPWLDNTTTIGNGILTMGLLFRNRDVILVPAECFE